MTLFDSVDEADFFEGSTRLIQLYVTLLNIMTHAQEIDVTHSRIKSIRSLNLGRFEKATSIFPLLLRLMLRNSGYEIIKLHELILVFRPSLVKLDFYDNLIHRIQNLDGLENLTSLDLSYNKIKHIKGVKHLKKLKELYFVQNGISRIEELDGLENLTSLELGANRIRV